MGVGGRGESSGRGGCGLALQDWLASRKTWHLPPTLASGALSRNAWVISSGKESPRLGQSPWGAGGWGEPQDMGPEGLRVAIAEPVEQDFQGG